MDEETLEEETELDVSVVELEGMLELSLDDAEVE